MSRASEQKWQEIFEHERPRLLALAYRMLGLLSDAEDVMQEAWLRLHKADKAGIEQPAAWLTTIVTRLSIDRLRVTQRARSSYVGPWLPEPCQIDPAPNPEDQAELADTLSMAFMLLLEKLAPVERAVFLLREAFDYNYDEIAKIIGNNAPACRQILRRAKTRLAEQRPRFTVNAQEHQRLLYGFGAAVAGGDLDGLFGLFAEDIELWTDGGGKVIAALNVVHGAANVARFFVAMQKKLPDDFTVKERCINGLPGIIALQDGAVNFMLSIEEKNGRIRKIFMVRNPDKLSRVH